jgi:hypothetical protein
MIAALTELKTEKICAFDSDITGDCNAVVTLMSRRMRKDRDNRKKTANRVEKHRNKENMKQTGNDLVTPMFDVSSSSSSCTKVHSPPNPPGGSVGEEVHSDHPLKPCFDGLISTQKIPALKFEHVVRVHRDHPRAGLDVAETVEELVDLASGWNGTVLDALSWLRKKASAIEVRRMESGAGADQGGNEGGSREIQMSPELVERIRKKREAARAALAEVAS